MKRLLVCIVLLLGACKQTQVELEVKKQDPLLVKIKESVELIEAHSRRLKEVEMARYTNKYGEQNSAEDLYVIPGLFRVINLGTTWRGPIEPLITELSVYAGLNPPRFIGVKPVGGVNVVVDSGYKRILDIFSDVHHKSATRATLELKMKEKLFEVKYSGI